MSAMIVMKTLYILSLLLQALQVYGTDDFCSQLIQQDQTDGCHYSSFSDFDGFNLTDYEDCSVINFTFQADHVQLNAKLTFSELGEVSLQGGAGGRKTKVLCSRNGGLQFEHICSLKITHVEFVNCGVANTISLIDSTKPVRFYYAVLIIYSVNITIHHSVFRNSHGTGLVLKNSRNVEVSYCKFIDNSIKRSYLNVSSLAGMLYGGGGGMRVEASCNSESNERYCNGTTYSIVCCEFRNNAAVIENTIASHSTTPITGIGNGGGMGLWFWNVSYHHIVITDSVFHQNSAVWGGGLQVVLCNWSKNNSITLDDSEFDSNTALVNGGGGIDMGYIGGCVQRNVWKFRRLNITGNTAMLGGGTAIFTYKVYELLSNYIHFEETKWIGNVAHYGAAINIAPQRLDMQTGEQFMRFENCSFESNGVFDAYIGNHIKQSGKGILMVTSGVISFKGNTKFVNNNSTCVYAVSAILHFINGTNALFLNNSARSGAGISLIGYSLIVVADHTSITFCNNTVLSKGAGIYYFSIDKNAYINTRTCYIQKLDPAQSSENVYFNFFGNRALSNPVYVTDSMKSDTMYGSSLASCSNPQNVDFPYEFKCVGNFRQCNVCESSVMDVYNNNTIKLNCYHDFTYPRVTTIENNISLDLHMDNLTFIPGKKFEIPLIESGSRIETEALYDISIRNHGSSNITIPPSFTVVSKHKLILYAKPGDSATITLTELGFRKYTISFVAMAIDCPPLYKLETEVKKCACYLSEDLIFVEFHKCNSLNYFASIRIGYWIDYIEVEPPGNDTSLEKKEIMDRYVLLSSYCPLGYCSYATKDNYRELPKVLNRNNLSESVCHNRSGTLCGVCVENMTIYFHSESFKCGKTDQCHLGALYYLLSEILPMTLLFLFVIIFNISFTSGNLNGFIFFAQMYDSISKVGESFIPHSLQYSNLSVFHRLVYKIFNIDFFDIDELSFCLFKTRSTLNILMMKYVSVGYAFLLVVGTIWLIRCCSKFKCFKVRKSKYSVIQGLAAFMVMVYSQSTYISFSILNVIDIYKGSQSYKRVVFFQGDIIHFSKAHLPYAIPALLCILLFVTLIPLVLIAYPLCNKILAFLGLAENRFINKLLIPFVKIKPLLDCFQGTFKDKYRFFAGLYFVYRATILSSRFGTGVILIFTLIEIQLIIMIAFHAIAWPYQKKIHNVIDLLIFVDLAIINSLKLLNFFYAESGVKIKHIRIIHWMQLFFIYIPLVGVGLWVLYNLTCKFKLAVKKTARRISRDSDDAPVNDRYEGNHGDCDQFFEEDYRSRLVSENYHMMKRKKLAAFSID